jgi:cytochrome c oxidase subunit 2
MNAGRRRILAGGAALAAAAASTALVRAQGPRIVKVKAFRWQFDPNNIQLKAGEPVLFELTTADVFMGFSIPDFKVRADIVPGKVNTLALTPDKRGTFTFLCDVFCGDGHETMSGTLVVT